ncbi:CbtB domain-containing protein [Pseudomonas aeruginosa]|jgi:cobalt transporter subunit CbtB|uniref:CbtB domain-containing protein n=1 Tax=Pseudomonas aeruginosa TaxID=287 RepID=UPI00074456B8|nr:CbtB domain-containing protein [Pseudomonas aeruginosa]ALZ25327.1 cobalt transporter [Pseudomonas aeruginosa]WIK38071.1 CbtB-domain containing protein [Pseudomonas aeruginosa]HCL3733906.1 CbtB-domain containing protein [Pseudomonas aeruginosa]
MSSTVLTHASSRTRSQQLLVTLGSILMGLSLVYFAGFSHLDLVHNAAHDTRHSSGFPCH